MFRRYENKNKNKGKSFKNFLGVVAYFQKIADFIIESW